MINFTAYNTLIGEHIDTNKISNAIKKALILGLNKSTLDVISSLEIIPVFILTNNSITSEIPQFSHPILVSDRYIENGTKYLVTDLRQFIRQDDQFLDISSMEALSKLVRNRAEFDLARAREMLNMIWLNDGVNVIANTLMFADVIYQSWIADSISKKYALDMREAMTVSVISHIFYQSLFTDEELTQEYIKEHLVPHTIKITKAPVEFVEEIVSRITTLKTIEDLCDNIVSIVGGIKLKSLNGGVLITIIKNSWFGVNHEEMLAIALEHPPTWISIVFMALTERTFKNSPICRISEKFAKQEQADIFVKAFTHMLQSHLVQKTSAFEGFKENLTVADLTP